MGKKVLTILRLVAVVLFMSYYGGATMFYHTHEYEWGSVTHSHPYLPSSGHSHTVAALQTIDHLSSIAFDNVFHTVTLLLIASPVAYIVSTSKLDVTISYFDNSLRAPPATCSAV